MMPITDAGPVCATDPDAFDERAGDEHLRDICLACPLINPCLEWAILQDLDGFAGGLSQTDRRRLAKAIS